MMSFKKASKVTRSFEPGICFQKSIQASKPIETGLEPKQPAQNKGLKSAGFSEG
jgi:hypothetical protein